MREKTPDIPDIRDIFEKKESILKVSKNHIPLSSSSIVFSTVSIIIV